MNVTRVSRPLVGILGLTILVGALAYNFTHRHKGTPANAMADAPSAPPSQATPPADPNRSTEPRGVIGDASAPATRPAILAVAISAPAPLPIVSAADAKGLLAEGKAKIDAGDLLGGRQTLNEALNSGELSAPDVALAKTQIADANKTIIFSNRHFSDDPYGGTFTVPPGGVMARIAKTYCVTPELLCRINAMTDPRRLRASQIIKVVQGPFHAVVNKSAFTMDLYLGGVPGEKSTMYVETLPVGLGKDDSTPTGTWIVEPGRKLTNPKYYSPRGEGVIDAADPKNPLGKFWIGIAGTDGQAVGKTSYGIHGTIDPTSIGKQASMGCIRMHNEDIALVYEMLVEGKSSVIVKD